MQSFKSYLKEDTDKYPVLAIAVVLLGFADYSGKKFDDFFSPDSRKKMVSELREKFKKEYNISIKSIWYSYSDIAGNNKLFCDVNLDKENYVSSPEVLEQFKKTCKSVIDEYNEQYNLTSRFTITNTWVSVQELPLPFKINVTNVELNTSNIKNIEKYINCEMLQFYDLDTIKDGLLGILKIPALKSLTYSLRSTSKKLGWYDILEYHVENGKNILKCQRELIQNGFKDFAK